MNIQRCGLVNFKAKVCNTKIVSGRLIDNHTISLEQGDPCAYAIYERDSEFPKFSLGAGTIAFMKKTDDGLQLILKPGEDDKGKDQKENYEVMLTNQDHIFSPSSYDTFKKAITADLDKVSGQVRAFEANKGR